MKKAILALMMLVGGSVFAQAYIGAFTVSSSGISQAGAAGITGGTGEGTSHVAAEMINVGVGSAQVVMTPGGLNATQAGATHSTGQALTELTGLGQGVAKFDGQAAMFTNAQGSFAGASQAPAFGTLPALPTLPAVPVYAPFPVITPL